MDKHQIEKVIFVNYMEVQEQFEKEGKARTKSKEKPPYPGKRNEND